MIGYHVHDPERYGVVEFDDGRARSSRSRRSPRKPKSNYAVTGLYFYDDQVVEIAARTHALRPGRARDHRREPRLPRARRSSTSSCLGRGVAWLDTGTHEALLQAANFIQAVQERQGLRVSCPEEIGWRNGWIGREDLLRRAEALAKNPYGIYLRQLAEER